MKVSINLATQPFRKDRPILVASGAVGLLMLGALALLILLAVADHRRSADTRRVISRLDQQLRRAATEQARLDALLHRPENAEVLERSLFLNYELMVAFYDPTDIQRFARWIERQRDAATVYRAQPPGLVRDVAEGLLLWLAFQL